MTDKTGEFRAEVAASLAGMLEDEPPRSPEDHPHPTVDELIAYREERLGDPEADRLQEHLVTCRECLDRLAEVEDFLEASAQGPPEVGSLEQASAWRALRARQAAPGRTVPLALAASFLVAAIGLGIWAGQERIETARLRGQIAALSQPQPDTQIVDLYSESQVRSGDATEQPPVDLTDVEHLTLILHPSPELPDFAVYEAEIADAEGSERWRGPLRMDKDGALTLWIPGAFLAAGTYRIGLYGVEGDNRQLLETFPRELVSIAQ